MAFGYIDLHQSSLMNRELDRPEIKPVERVEYRLDGPARGLRTVFHTIFRGGHQYSFPVLDSLDQHIPSDLVDNYRFVFCAERFGCRAQRIPACDGLMGSATPGIARESECWQRQRQ